MKKILVLLTALVLLLTLCMSFMAAADTVPTDPCPAKDSERNGGNHGWYLVEDTEPTCTEPGRTVYECCYCSKTKTETKPALGHDFCEWDPNKEPTCTEPGSAVRFCSRCLLQENGTIPALGHDFGEWVRVKEPTCTEEGREERTCRRCGFQETRPIDPLGHNWGKWNRIKDPTCTEPGKEEHKCSRCGLTKSREVDPLGHDFGPWIEVDPSTCVHHGKEVSTCRRCGLEGERELPLTDHTWGPWYIIVYPTPSTPGLEESDCQVCGLERYREIYMDVSDVITSPALMLSGSKMAPKDKYKPGDQLGIGYTVTNIGDETLYNVSVVLTQPNVADSIVIDGITLLPNGEAYSNICYTQIPVDFTADSYDVSLTAFGLTNNMVGVKSNTIDFVHPIDDGFGWLPPPPDAWIVKSEISEPKHPEGYQVRDEIVYEITFSIATPADDPARNVKVMDKGEVIASFELIESSDPITVNYTAHVTDEDVVIGYVENVATLIWDDDFDEYEIESNKVIVPVIDTREDVIPEIIKEVTSVPENGVFYRPGETAHFVITVHNPSEKRAFYVDIVDPFPVGEDGVNGEQRWDNIQLPVDAVVTAEYDYTVTWTDAINGSMTNIAYYIAMSSDGESIQRFSNPVTIPCDYDFFDDYDHDVYEGTPLITKTVISTPANGKYYQEGETVSYLVSLTNTTDYHLDEALTYDVMGKEPSYLLGWAMAVDVGESCEYIFDHVVTKEDVQRGKITNFAFAEYSIVDFYSTVFSNIVTVYTKEQQDNKEEEEKRIEVRGAYESCWRTLDAEGSGVTEYTRHTCGTHMAVANAAEKLLVSPAAGDETKGWAGVQKLWSDAINQMYDELCSWAETPDLQMIVVKEQSLYFAQLQAWQATLKGDPADVSKQVAEALRWKCNELCYEIHNAPTPRLDTHHGQDIAVTNMLAIACEFQIMDSQEPDLHYAQTMCGQHRAILDDVMTMTAAAKTSGERSRCWKNAQQVWIMQLDGAANARYTSADSAGKKVFANERVAFGKWLEARYDLLKVLYPGETDAEEMLCNAIIERVIADCE